MSLGADLAREVLARFSSSWPERRLARELLSIDEELRHRTDALAFAESARGLASTVLLFAAQSDKAGNTSEGNVLRDAASLLFELAERESEADR
jgi:hypothetical protein